MLSEGRRIWSGWAVCKGARSVNFTRAFVKFVVGDSISIACTNGAVEIETSRVSCSVFVLLSLQVNCLFLRLYHVSALQRVSLTLFLHVLLLTVDVMHTLAVCLSARPRPRPPHFRSQSHAHQPTHTHTNPWPRYDITRRLPACHECLTRCPRPYPLLSLSHVSLRGGN